MEAHRLGAGARLSLVWQAGIPERPPIDTVDHVASYARSLVEALTLAGYQPLRIDVSMRAQPPRVVEIDVHGDVPRLDQASFARFASMAIAACNLWAALDADAEIRLRPRLRPSEAALVSAETRPAVSEPLLPHPALALAAPPAAPTKKAELVRATPAPAAAATVPAGATPPVLSTHSPLPPLPGQREGFFPGGEDRSPHPQPDRHQTGPVEPDKPRLATRVLLALLFGGLLGLFGLPRLTPQFGPQAQAPAAQPPVTQAPLPTQARPSSAPQPTLAPTPPPAPTPVPTQPAPPTPAPRPTQPPQSTPDVAAPAESAQSRVLFAERFVSPLDGWPHDPNGTAWFGDGSYQLMVREPGRFVAIGTPLPGPVGDVTMSARFRKTGGPPGGGYGLVVRSQGGALDGDNQLGTYIVLEASDRGEIGVWQRDESRWLDIVPWTHSSAVRVGREANELSVSTQTNRVVFVVNGVEVVNMTHASMPAQGGVGIFVGGDMNEVSLEWLIVETPGTLIAR
jgi:hypothetical protein